MHNMNADFYRQQYQLLMRAVCRAINELDQNAPELARNTLATAWDNAVETGFQRLLSETTL